MRWILIASLVGFPQAASAQGDVAPVVVPTSDWVLDYGEDRCRIVRSFGEGDTKSIIYFEQAEPSSVLNWVVAGPLLGPLRAKSKVTVQFGPGNPSFEMEHQGATLGQFGDALSSTGFRGMISETTSSGDPENAQRFDEMAKSSRTLVPSEGAKVEWLEIRPDRSGPVRFALGNMQPAYEAMNACMANLVTHWGLDPQRELQRVSGPVPTNPEVVATRIQRKYPHSALEKGQQALIAARVMVDAEGKITDCAIVELTEAEKFGAGVCRQITSTARFDPAVDASGAAMPSYYVFRIRYVIP